MAEVKCPGLRAKMNNRRVTLIRDKNSYVVRCKKLAGKREIKGVEFSLSHEAMQNLVLMWLLLEQQSGHFHRFFDGRPGALKWDA